MLFFFFNDTATTEIYTLSLHDALPIWAADQFPVRDRRLDDHLRDNWLSKQRRDRRQRPGRDRKSTRLNSSHSQISYAVFCLKKKKNNHKSPPQLLTRHYNTHQLQSLS